MNGICNKKCRIIMAIKNLFLAFLVQIEQGFNIYKNYYPCKLIGERTNKEPYNTVILYRIVGKREIFETTIRELLADQRLVEKFHPTEAAKLGAIAMGDSLFHEESHARKKRFDFIKWKMLKATKG